MQLVYIWTESYRNLNISDGIFLSSEYTFCFSKENSKLEISINRNYIPNFYGKNIYDVTALVGINGAGKTTMAHIIMNYRSMLKNAYTQNNKFIQIYKTENSLKIYYYWGNEKLEIQGDSEIKIEQFIVDHTYAGREVPELFPVYISNVFNISDDKVGDSYYTPYACLKGIVYNEKQQYGQGWNSYLHNNISAYSEYMVNDVLRYYSNFQGGLYIKCYEHIPESVRNDLHIFEKYVVGVHQFGNFYKDLSQKVDEKLDKEIKMIKQKFSADQIREFEFFRQCYLTLLCETYLFFGKTKTEDEEIKESTIGIKIDEYLKNRKLDIDINLLKDISCEIKAMQNGAFENLDWFKQFEASIPVFKEYKGKDFKVGYKRFGESDDILKFYMDECIKNYSNFKRYMIFHPWFISSGEEALTNIFAYLCEAMLKIKGKNIILVIDEIDAYLHPTWQQSILKSLTDGLQEFYPDRTFQIVFTTHSPIVLSDLTGDRVLCLEKKDKEIVVMQYFQTSSDMNMHARSIS